MAGNCQRRKRGSVQGMVLVMAFYEAGKQQRHALNLLPGNYTNADLLHCKFLAKVIREPRSTASVSSAFSKCLTMFSLFILLTEALVSDWHCLVTRVAAAMARILCSLSSDRAGLHRQGCKPGRVCSSSVGAGPWSSVLGLRWPLHL